MLSNCSNNYGPFHFPEKLIPVVILNALAGKPIPVYGRGENVRDWLFVEDHATRAPRGGASAGAVGESYNIGGNAEAKNIDIVHAHLRADGRDAAPRGAPHERLITFVTDRPGHDFRYAIDAVEDPRRARLGSRR